MKKSGQGIGLAAASSLSLETGKYCHMIESIDMAIRKISDEIENPQKSCKD